MECEERTGGCRCTCKQTNVCFPFCVLSSKGDSPGRKVVLGMGELGRCRISSGEKRLLYDEENHLFTSALLPDQLRIKKSKKKSDWKPRRIHLRVIRND